MQNAKHHKEREHSSCTSSSSSSSCSDHHDGDLKKRCYEEKTCKRTKPKCHVKRKDGKTKCERRCYTVCEVRCEKPCAKKTSWSYQEKFEGEWECFEHGKEPSCADDSSDNHKVKSEGKKKLLQKK